MVDPATAAVMLVRRLRRCGEAGRVVHVVPVSDGSGASGLLGALCGISLLGDEVEMVEPGVGVPCTGCLLYRDAMALPVSVSTYREWGWPVRGSADQAVLDLGAECIAVVLPAGLARAVTAILAGRDRRAPVLVNPGAPQERTLVAGELLVDLEGPLSAGNLIALRRDGAAPQLRGQVLPWLGRFMPMRRDLTAADYHLPTPDRDTTSPVDTGLTTVDPAQLDGDFRFLAQLYLPSGTFHTLTAGAEQSRPTHTRLVSPGGSWCEVAREPGADGRYAVRQAGIQRLWSTVEAAHRQWRELGEPEWSRFGVTVTPTDQHMWLDDPDHSPYRWPLWTPNLSAAVTGAAGRGSAG